MTAQSGSVSSARVQPCGLKFDVELTACGDVGIGAMERAVDSQLVRYDWASASSGRAGPTRLLSATSF